VSERAALKLSAGGWRAFLSCLDKAKHRRPKLQAAAKRYRRRRGNDAEASMKRKIEVGVGSLK
jgi:uncharacterized protein (DUF1778 family)